jgi:hypothetical protein
MTNPFSSPAAPGAPDPAPRPRDLVGCLVAYSPREFTKAGAPGNEKGVGGSDPRDRVTTDLILLETPGGAPIAFGGSPEWEQDPKPHYLQVAGPAKFDGCWVSNQTIVNALAPGGQPLVGQLILGRIERSDFGRKPFNLVAVAGTPLMDRAIQIYTALAAGAIAYNAPAPIPGVPQPVKATAAPGAPMPPQVNYGYTPTATPPMPPAAPAPVMPPMPTAPPVPTAPPAADAFAAWQAQQSQAALVNVGFTPVPAALPVMPQAPALEPQLVASGWTPDNWAQLNPDQKSQVRVSVGLPPF